MRLVELMLMAAVVALAGWRMSPEELSEQVRTETQQEYSPESGFKGLVSEGVRLIQKGPDSVEDAAAAGASANAAPQVPATPAEIGK